MIFFALIIVILDQLAISVISQGSVTISPETEQQVADCLDTVQL